MLLLCALALALLPVQSPAVPSPAGPSPTGQSPAAPSPAGPSPTRQGPAGQDEPAEPAPLERLALEDTLRRPNPLGWKPADVRWDPSGREILHAGARTAPATGEHLGAAPEAEEPAAVRILAAQLELDAEAREELELKSESADGRTALVERAGELWVVAPAEGAPEQGHVAVRLAAAEGGELHELSPDGRWLAWHAAGDLFAADVRTGAASALTQGGGPRLLHGKLDWVYQEEIYGRGNFKGFWWSPRSDRIAFLRLDESPVHDFTIVDHSHPDGSMRVLAEVTAYPKVGDPNPLVALCAADLAPLAEGKPAGLATFDTSDYAGGDPGAILIVSVGWDPAGERVIYAVQDRIQTWLDLVAGDPASGAPQVLVRERSETWVDVLDPPRWLADGSFLWASQRSGHEHLYRYTSAGLEQGALTSGEWDVQDTLKVDEAAGRLWFATNKDGSLDRQVYSVDLDGENLARLTQGPGTHELEFGADGWFLDEVSTLTEPPVTRLCRPDGSIVRTYEALQEPAGSAFEAAAWELLEIPARDGFALDAALLKPADFDPAKSYPVWIPTYSGPEAPSVTNRWNADPWAQFLAQEGVLVFQVNVRTASKKGHAVTAACYKRLGIPELADLEDALDWLCAHPWADARRVGIAGSSYGGFMTAFALTHSDRFRLGIAAAGVYDWRLYDTIYTERYMQTPELNPEGYAATSVIAAAANLRGHLILTHGTLDDNVHMQGTIQLVHALQEADRQFELMLYPETRHRLAAPKLRLHERRLSWNAIQEWLLAPAAVEAPAQE